MEERQKRGLLMFGVLLFLLGMMTGFVLSLFTNPRVGLSARLAGVQGGMVLMIFGLMWNNIQRSRANLKMASWLSIYSMYITWIGLLLSAIWGTHFLIAGAGFHASMYQELTVLFMTLTGAIAIVVAAIIILSGLFAHATRSRDAGTA